MQRTEMREADRILRICNACRYCEGYCAVFPAMERRTNFSQADLNYLANLCHKCGECLDACQYAPPHEFAVDVPKVLEQVRQASWRQYAWPGPLAVWPLVAIGFAVPSVLSRSGPNFYSVIPHATMVWLFGSAIALVAIICAIGLMKFWHQGGERFSIAAIPIRDILTLRYAHHSAQRWFHHFTFYGFALCFVSTTTAAYYHYFLHLKAPYAYLSLPVLLGTVGGFSLTIGTLGFFSLKHHSSFLFLLFLTSVSGLALLALRETTSMRSLLILHLGLVLALFLSLPYGKFVHGIYRSAALIRYTLESRGVRR